MAASPRQLALVALAACSFDRGYGDATVACSTSDPRCPDGYVCEGGICRDHRADADASPGPDASVCQLASGQPDNDRCADAIPLTVDAAGVTVYGDTTGYAGDVAPATLPGCTGSVEPGPDAIYRVDLPAGATLTADLAPVGFDGAVYLLDGCSLTAACHGGADALGVGAIDHAVMTAPTAGTYYVVVDASMASAAGCYRLSLVRP